MGGKVRDEPGDADALAVRGPRGAERALLDAVAAHQAGLRADPEGWLALPLRIIVPSRSLREHLSAALIDHFRQPLLAISIQTLYGTALEALERCGEPPPGSEALFPVVVRQHARRQPALREKLDGLIDGYAAVEAGVSDLLDAGFEPHHAEAVAEFLAESAIGREAAQHGRALVDVAVACLATLEGSDFGHRSRLLRGAADEIAKEAARAVPAREIWIHGFADATGAAADLIAALLRYGPARIVLQEAAEPGEAREAVAGEGFTARFREHVESVVGVAAEGSAVAASEPARFALFDAPGANAEARAVALRLQQRIEAGARPERIGIVARDLGPYAQPLRLHLRRLGVPFSALSTRGPGGAQARRLDAVLALLRGGARAPVDRWLDALSPDAGRAALEHQRSDLRLAFRRFGAARLGDAVSLSVVSDRIGLPVRSGLHAPEDDGHVGAPRRWLAASLWNDALAALRAAHRRLSGWPDEAPLEVHRRALRGLLLEDLGWGALGHDVCRALSDASAGFPLSRDDFLLLVGRAVRGIADDRFGGRGGGVQILDVTEARACCFDVLFVLGMNRDVFPRVISEDPLLPDSVRVRLRELLPDLPVKATGHDEERYLFAQLAAASPEVTLSWQSCGDDGKARAPSTLIEGLLRRRPDLVLEHAAAELAAPEPEAAGTARPAREHALQAALHGPRDLLDRLLPLALQPVASLARLDPATLAAGRLAVLRELDLPPRGGARPLGPYYGFIGPVREDADLRRADLFVTALEQGARCPWQYFVEKLLRIQAPPDPGEALPDVDALLLGSAVHRALEEIAAAGDSAGRPEGLADAAAHAAPWPGEAELDALLERVCRGLVADHGTWLPGLALVLAARARPQLERARSLAWPAERVVGVEVRGALAIADDGAEARTVHFVADRVDRDDDGLILIDYKTGKPPSTAVKAETRRGKLLDSVRLGKLLQAAAYARATGGRGRYTYLRPQDPQEMASYEVDAGDPEFIEAFEWTARVVLRAREAGAFFPRLAESSDRSQPHPQCRSCAVAQACLHGDSGAKRRLVDWVEAARESRAPAAGDRGAHEALLALFDLGREGPRKRKEGTQT